SRMTPPPATVLALLVSLPPYSGDRAESRDERATRLAPVAEVISAVARNRSEVAMLVSLAVNETQLSAAVQLGNCAALGKHACDNGKARGVFQLHEEACRSAYAFPAGSVESLRAEAQCAIRLLRWNAERGREHALSPQ